METPAIGLKAMVKSDVTISAQDMAERLLPCRKDVGNSHSWHFDCRKGRHDHDCEARFRPAVSAALAERDARIADLSSQIAAKEVEIGKLREALEPFAKAADIRLCGEWRDDEAIGRTDVGFHVKFGDLRKARAALKPQDGEKS